MSFAYLHECFPDPTKTFVYREVVAMRVMGMEPVVFSVREPSGEEKARMEAIDVPVRYLPEEAELRRQIDAERKDFSRRQRKALSHWRAQKGDSNRVFEALWLGRELRRLGIRHVHAHFAGLAARTAWLVRELWGIGYSFTGHADDIFSPEAKPISLEMLVRDARFIATETDYSRARLEREFAAAQGKTFRVFNGIGVVEPGTLREGMRDAVPRILSVGRLVEKKGFPDLLRAMAMLRDRGVGFTCDLVGGGPMESEIRAMIETLELGNCVGLHGAQPQSAVRKFLGDARVFALAAQTEGDGGSDNLPTVIMEAMAAGLPVVSTRIAGIPEMVDDGQTGALVGERDVPALAEALQRYLQDATLAGRHGEAGKRRAMEKFQVTVSAERLAELLVQRAGIVPPAALIVRYPAWRVSFLRRVLRTFGVGG
jgi:colanic acid/amylovoran biosynthesis glycosyltransferase